MNKHRVRRRFALAVIAGVVVILGLVTGPAQTTQADLPPRPTPPAESHSDLSGAPIELRVRFSQAAQAARWQELWTVVQWQDAFGSWHDVEGWKGALDEISGGEGKKVWWVYQRDLSKGPFQWSVYQSPSGKLLARSEPFYLPGADGRVVRMSVTLKP
jgi:hypothetical protein